MTETNTRARPHDEVVGELCARVFRSLARSDQRMRGQQYVRGLLEAEGRKSVRNIAAAIGDPASEQNLHHFVASSTWAWQPVRRALAQALLPAIRPDAWVVRPAVIRKVGEHTVGVSRRFVPDLGQVINDIAGGGYGPLSRRHGLTVDHLYAVEVVVVDATGTARRVVATREPGDPNRDLWWAHTGAGGGNFGVVTRYWFRSPGVAGPDPATLLPRPPSEVLVSTVSWSWADLDRAAFSRILRNFGDFYERESAPDPPYATLFSQLKPQHKSAGSFAMTSQIDAAVPGAQRLLDDYVAAVGAGVGLQPAVVEARRISWLHAVTQWPGFTATDVSTRFKAKSAYMRRGFTEPQIAAFHRHLTRDDYHHPVSLVMITSYGGRINTVAPDATAVAQRDSVIKLHYVSFWTDEAQDPVNIGWIREFYRDVYADTGGVPAPGANTDGTFINYADVDVADPALNRSGIGWERLYFKDNYPALQAVKARFDPRNLFRHALSVRLP